jgi:D-alanyl-D-alanine carboxypeptidase (penicillin-binding protein 5/6)
MKLRKIIIGLIIAVMTAMPISIKAEEPEIHAFAYVLMEADTGQILRASNEHERIYPASTIKILTALLLTEHLDLNGVYIAGPEIGSIPWDSSTVGHVVGEAVSGENMLRSIIMPSGNDTATIIAMQTALLHTGEGTMPYSRAEATFAGLMNQRARALGAHNSNFVNPHGYHHPHQYTTAYDMALIARAVTQNEEIMRIARETSFSGPSAVSDDPEHKIVQYSASGWRAWRTRNELLLPNSAHHYPYATGLRTGWNDQAGPSVIATATRDGMNLIAVIYNAPPIIDENGNEIPTRWADAVYLFEYGFNNYGYHTLTEADVLGEIGVVNQAIGQPDGIEYTAQYEFTMFMRNEDWRRIQRVINIDRDLLIEGEDGELRLNAPVTEGDIIGSITFYLDEEQIFTGNVYAAQTILERNFNTDVDHWFAKISEILFTARAIPFWLIGVAVVLLVIFVVIKVREHNAWKNDYTLSRRY